LVVNYGAFTAPNMKVKARHSETPPRCQRSTQLFDPCTRDI
jgi:hypothetical protein